MTTYEVQFSARALKELEKLPRQEQQRIVIRAEHLAINPHPPGSQKVHGRRELFRVRIGDYRVVYDVQDDVLTVMVVRVGHRRDVYRNMEDL